MPQSGSQSPERACQPSSRMNVSTPIRLAIGAVSRMTSSTMSSLAPSERMFASVPFELKVTSLSKGSARCSVKYLWNCHGSSSELAPKPTNAASSA